jgi:hypothetical protein
MMAGAAHDPVFAKKVGVPTKVAKDFNRADDKSGFLSSAMRAKGPAFQEGGKVKKYAEGGQVPAEPKVETKPEPKPAPKPRSDSKNPDRGTITPRVFDKPPQYAKGGGVKGKGCEQRGTRPAKYY